MELSILSSYSLCYSIINGGNTGVLKHASNVQDAFAIEDALLRQDLRSIYEFECGIKRVKTLIENKNIAAITLTGSDPTGRSVASAGQTLRKQ
jgi:succinate-semialdehyde dehydrogenase/glutarate-semialdehyde dehydrogenase